MATGSNHSRNNKGYEDFGRKNTHIIPHSKRISMSLCYNVLLDSWTIPSWPKRKIQTTNTHVYVTTSLWPHWKPWTLPLTTEVLCSVQLGNRIVGRRKKTPLVNSHKSMSYFWEWVQGTQWGQLGDSKLSLLKKCSFHSFSWLPKLSLELRNIFQTRVKDRTEEYQTWVYAPIEKAGTFAACNTRMMVKSYLHFPLLSKHPPCCLSSPFS